MKSKKILWENWVVFLGGLAVLMTAFFLSPDPRGYGTHEHLHLPPCFFFRWTHVPCPSCGLTTSFAYLAKGQFLKGAQIHPMGPVLFVALLILTGSSFFNLLRNRSFWDLLENRASLWTGGLILTGLLLTWITRLWIHERHLFAFGS
jgi:hypothetical protein